MDSLIGIFCIMLPLVIFFNVVVLFFVCFVFLQLMFVFCCLVLFMNVMLICVCDALWDPLENEMVNLKGS